MKATTYSRVSTDLQDFNRQIEDIKTYCKNNGFSIIKEFAEKETGRNDARPVLIEMLKYLNENNNEVKYLIVSELSRLGRTNEVLNTINFLNRKGICLISLKENIRTLNEDGSINGVSSLITTILSGINSFELETLKYRIKSGIRKSIIDGKANGSIMFPYGYKKAPDKKLVIDDDEKEVIKTIFNLYIEGYGTKRISNYLNENNIPCKTKILFDKGLLKNSANKKLIWVDGPVYEILINPIYKGFRRFKGELLEQPSLKIVEPEIFNLVQELLKNHSSKQGINKKYNFLLKNKKIICGVCGKTYFPYRKYEKKTNSYPDNRYMCLSKRYKNSECTNYGISIDKMEMIVQSIVISDFTELLIKKLDNKIILNQIEEKKKVINEIQSIIDKTLKNELQLTDLLLNGDISKETFDVKNKQLKTIINSKNRDIQLLNEEMMELKSTYENIKDIKNIENRFKKGVFIEKEVINKIIKKIVISPCNMFGDNFKIESGYDDVYNEEYNENPFPKSYDKVVELKVYIGDTITTYYLSQRENYYINNDFSKVQFPELKKSYDLLVKE
jgi:site-specific DNA recombinase